MVQWLILLHEIVKTFPRNWDVLAPVVEYVIDTEIGENGFSAHELQTGYSLLQEPDSVLAPFMIPRGVPETDIVSRLFSNFRRLAGILHRQKSDELAKKIDQVNRTRHLRNLEKGETVFRRMPVKARGPKSFCYCQREQLNFRAYFNARP